MDRSRWKGATRALALAGALAAATCIDATDVDLLEFDADGTVFGIVYLDADGNPAVKEDGSSYTAEDMAAMLITFGAE